MRGLRDKYRIGIDAVIEHRYHNFVEWDPEALRHFRDVIEDSIKEAHAREHQIFNRAGALLSLCGVVLALIASFGIGMGFPDDVGIFLSVGTVMILISCFVIGWSIVPNYRVTISMSSGEDGYDLHLKDPDRLFALITAERATMAEHTMMAITSASAWMGHGICILSCGLSFIALSIVIAMLGSSVWICLLFAAVTVVGLCAIEWRNLAKTYRRVEDEADLEQGVRRR